MGSAGNVVLVVDDERVVADLIQTGLKRKGYTVQSFLDPEEAYQFFATHPGLMCAVITDCTMPKLTGWDLARKLFELAPDTPIVMITGLVEADVPEDLRDRLHRVLHKPFTQSEILEAVVSAGTCRTNGASAV